MFLKMLQKNDSLVTILQKKKISTIEFQEYIQNTAK